MKADSKLKFSDYWNKNEGLSEGSEGLPKGLEDLSEGSEGLPEGPESLPEGPEGPPGRLGGDGWMDG